MLAIIIIIFAALVFLGMALAPMMDDYMKRELRKDMPK
jgi:hypothetical protein